MILQRIASPGIAHNSYFVGSGGDAAVIDPRRDCDVYLKLARENELRIKHIFETHRNEDYVIGSTALQDMTGAEIHHGPGLSWRYGRTLVDGEEFRLGSVALKALHTPGHTDESMSYTVSPSRGNATIAVFSGDALFAGDVGRTDLYGPSEAPRLASALYESIAGRLLPLGDEVILCPAHGAGSVCGTRIANRDNTTIGIEKKLNPFLKLGKDEFVARKLAEKPARPPYFLQMEKYNLEGPPAAPKTFPPPLDAAAFKDAAGAGAMIIDTREPPAFGGAHIEGSYSIWLDGLSEFAGWVSGYVKPILLVLEDPSGLDRAVSHMTRLGYDNIAGYLRAGFQTWYNAGLPVAGLSLLSVHHLKRMLDARTDIQVLDVRSDDEWAAGHIPDAKHIFLGDLENRANEVDTGKPVATCCSVGHRAGLAASILRRAGHPSVSNVLGSMDAWKAAGFPVAKG
jgi:hydroxyacylglutathione hydrolase